MEFTIKAIELNNSDKVVLRKVKVSELFKNIFINRNDNIISIYYRIKDVCFCVGEYGESILNDQRNLDRIKEFHNSYIEEIIEKERPNLVDIEVFKHLGLEYKSLEEKRASFDTNRIIEQQKKKDDAVNLYKEKREKEISLLKEKFLNDERVFFSEIISLANGINFTINARTLGYLNKYARHCFIEGNRGNFNKGVSTNTAQNIFSLVSDIKSAIQ